jgi:hypothetical protein
MAISRASGPCFGIPLSTSSALLSHVTKSRNRSYAILSKILAECEWIAKKTCFSTTGRLSTTATPSFAPATSQKRTVTSSFGTAFTLMIATSFGHVSSLCTPSIGTTFPSISKMFSIAHAECLPTRNAFRSGREIKSSSIRALVAGTPRTPTHQTLHSPRFHVCFRNLSTCMHPR